MKKIAMYYHGGAANHGCEAIVRATKKILNTELVLYSLEKDEDLKYELDKVVKIKDDQGIALKKNGLKYITAALYHKLFHNDYKYIELSHASFFNDANKGDIYLSIGGDNYCYKGQDILGYYNKCLHKKGVKTVLWGCSFEPENMTAEIVKDIARYDLIIARENLSYQVLKKINSNTVLLPDPAFQLDSVELEAPEGFKIGNTIGINISPLISNYAEKSLIIENYKNLIRYILNVSDSNIALIPHVVKDGNDDRILLNELYEEFKITERVVLIPDCNCMELKGYISRCRMFIGARTHATIAAYSTGVPTLVVGYSIKACGIAENLFGTCERYVLPVQNLKKEDDLVDAYCWLAENEERIKEYLLVKMKQYKRDTLCARTLINEL